MLGLLDNPDNYRFHDTALSPLVSHARHAVALDEKRASFAPTLWSDVKSTTDMKQIWFPGVHSDVGGGYLETGLSDGALFWMVTEAGNCGLEVRAGATGQLRPDALGVMHESCTGVFEALKTRPRTAPPIPTGTEELHPSAIQRNQNPPLSQGNYWPTTILAARKNKTVDIFAAERWNSTRFYLQRGKKYQFTASWQWIDVKD